MTSPAPRQTIENHAPASFRPQPLLRLFLAGALLATPISAQFLPDLDFEPPIDHPAFEEGAGPRLVIDEAHSNFHTADGLYLTFANLMRRDGYRVSSLHEPFSAKSLAGVDILVIGNAQGPQFKDQLSGEAKDDIALADLNSFTKAEAAALETWVRRGGSLMLIADHADWPAAASRLWEPYGIEWSNTWVTDGPDGARTGNLLFRKSDGTLAEHPVTEGVEQVADFAGSALRVPDGDVALLHLSPLATGVRRRGGDAPVEDVGGWLRGALLERGQGRIAVFAEASMFSAQVRGKERWPMGMNAPEAKDNAQFALNVVRWLARVIK